MTEDKSTKKESTPVVMPVEKQEATVEKKTTKEAIVEKTEVKVDTNKGAQKAVARSVFGDKRIAKKNLRKALGMKKEMRLIKEYWTWLA